jgi:hypothetical protein
MHTFRITEKTTAEVDGGGQRSALTLTPATGSPAPGSLFPGVGAGVTAAPFRLTGLEPADVAAYSVGDEIALTLTKVAP